MTRELHKVFMPFSSSEHNSIKTFLIEPVTSDDIREGATVKVKKFFRTHKGVRETGEAWIDLSKAAAVIPKEYETEDENDE